MDKLNLISDEATVLEYITETGRPQTLEDLAAVLDENKAAEAAKSLSDKGLLMLTKKGRLTKPEWAGCVLGKVQGNPKGYAFIIPEDKAQKGDIFVSSNDLNGAMHGDLVLVKITARAKRGSIKRQEGEVVSVIKRANTTIVGTFERNGDYGFVVPEETRISSDIFIPAGCINNAKTGDLVTVSVKRWPKKGRNAEGEIIEVLGPAGSAQADMLAILKNRGLDEQFDKKTLAEAAKAPDAVAPEETKGREDFRNILTVTIDGADAKDLDDAVTLEIIDGIYHLGVHIADVSYYVKPGSALDNEAYLRGTSVYFPDMVLPMLPEELSNGICSLNMGVDRLAVSCIMKIDRKGEIFEYAFVRSVINVNKRVTYEDANAMLEKGDTKLINEYGEVYKLLKKMAQLAELLQSKRRRRGSIDFELPECHIVLGADGRAVDVYPYERGISNAMIEEFMLSANECAARLAQKHNLPFLYRVHEEPDTERMDEFFTLVKALGVPYSKPKGDVTPKMLQTLLGKTAGLSYESVVSRVMLRCMKKARYCENNLGHFGLALEYYCHFTSPIRRYPDIVVHRAITAYLEGREKEFEKTRPLLTEMAEHTSERERNAMEAERDVDDLKKAEYMRDKIGNQYDGVISGVTEFGLFVELPNTVEGLIRITSLDDDYYIYDEKLYRLTGRHTGKVYSIGDKIKITVASVNMKMRKCEFVPAENGRAAKSGTKARHKG